MVFKRLVIGFIVVAFVFFSLNILAPFIMSQSITGQAVGTIGITILAPPIQNYTMIVYIDDVMSETFSQTAKPYLVTVHVLAEGVPAENVTVRLTETNGNNIFIPVKDPSKISNMRADGMTDSGGNVSFIIAPTFYPANPNYEIFADVFEFNQVRDRVNLSIQNKASLDFTTKAYVSPSASKAAANSMIQLINSLFIWANEMEEGIMHDIIVYDNGTITGLKDLKVGAPNVLNLGFRNHSDNSFISGYFVVQENSGFLLFNPSVVSGVDRFNIYSNASFGSELIVVPSQYATAGSAQVAVKVYYANNNLFDTIVFDIDDVLEPRTGGSAYSNSALKSSVNSMIQVSNSLFYALN